MRSSTRVLVTSAGRRGQLIQWFKREVGQNGAVLVADASPSAPAAYLADDWVLVPPVDDSDYLTQLLDVCEERAINLLVPTIDTELQLLAETTSSFEEMGTVVLISGPEAIRVALDKRETHSWLSANQFPCPQQWNISPHSGWPIDLPSPVFLKPAFGSRSIGARWHRSPFEFTHHPPSMDLVAQQFIEGREFTVSAYADRLGRCSVAVPRERVEIRDGEVSKAVTRHDSRIEDLVCEVVTALPGAWGPMNVQVIEEASTQQIYVIEINARFGGGDPLAWQAGANFPQWAIAEAAGGQAPHSTVWQDELAMLRFDDAVFLPWSD